MEGGPRDEEKYRGLSFLALIRERERLQRHQARIERDNMKSDD
jgi:hypothetical protein